MKTIGFTKSKSLHFYLESRCEHFNGDIELHCAGKKLEYKCFKKGTAPKIVSRKELDDAMITIKSNNKKEYKPAIDHPWRQSQTTKRETAMTTT